MKTHTNLLTLQEDSYSCRNYVVEMMYMLKDKFRDLGKDGFNIYMQDYFYEGIINIESKKIIMDNDEKSAIIPPEFAELSQGRNILFLKERVEACKSKIRVYRESVEIKFKGAEARITAMSNVTPKSSEEAQTSQESLKKLREQLEQLQKQKEELAKTLTTLQSKESRLNEIESTLEAVTQQKLENIIYGIDDFIENRLNATVGSSGGINKKEGIKKTIKDELLKLKNELKRNSSEDPTKICGNFLNKGYNPKGMSKQQQKTFAILKNVINDIKYGDKVRCVVNKKHLSHLDRLIEQGKKEEEKKDRKMFPIYEC